MIVKKALLVELLRGLFRTKFAELHAGLIQYIECERNKLLTAKLHTVPSP